MLGFASANSRLRIGQPRLPVAGIKGRLPGPNAPMPATPKFLNNVLDKAGVNSGY
jgi:hypothetical protein